jgi:glucose-1-phosphate thymidylyltransferase
VSKELLPLGFRRDLGGARPLLACDPLLEAFQHAGIDRALVVTRTDKLDLPAFLGAGPPGGPALAFVTLPESDSVPRTLDGAYPFLRGATIALGFPDILFSPRDAFATLLRRYEESGADLVLGLFPTTDPTTTDMVRLGAGDRVADIEVRPRRSALRFNWLLAVWSPAVTEHLHGALAGTAPGGDGEVQLGTLLRQAVVDGFAVLGVPFPQGRFVDLGTPEGFERGMSFDLSASPTAHGR